MPVFVSDSKAFLAKTLERIKSSVHERVAGLEATLWKSGEPLPFARRYEGAEAKVSVGETWGRLWDCAWFEFKGTVPESARGRAIDLLIDVSGEALVVDGEGDPRRGLTSFTSEFDPRLGRPEKTVLAYSERAEGGESVVVWADAACNDLFGKHIDSGVLRQAHIAIRHAEMRDLYYDYEVLSDLLGSVPEGCARYHSLLGALARASECLSSYTDEEAAMARGILAPELARRSEDGAFAVSAVGHAHIDLAWLWPLRETRRKAARSFSTVLANMDEYGDYVFGSSQAQLYQWIKEDHPSLFERIRERVREGRWEAQGGMWVEPDTNIPGGESLVRQFLYGMRFFEREFGRSPSVCWLPDTFGYTAALPQIILKSGLASFMTTKLSWNRHNAMPHDSFEWEGLDGSSVLAHMPPEGTYNSSALPHAIKEAERSYKDKGASGNCLLVFGIGDGGGGPGEEHLERLGRERSLGGLAPVRQVTAEAFFAALGAEAGRLARWRGELYLEKHQATYTSLSELKRWNSLMERELRDLEFLAVKHSLETGAEYPRDAIDALWKETLLYQFHDIIAGTSVQRVNRETEEGYRRMHERAEELLGSAAPPAPDRATTGERAPRGLGCAVNSLSWRRDEWIRAEGAWLRAVVPPMSVAPLRAGGMPAVSDLKASGDAMENACLAVSFGAEGEIASIFDKRTDRELVKRGVGGANRLYVYDDDGDAWDFADDYRRRNLGAFELLGSECFVDGPRIVRRARYRFGGSTLEQDIVLWTGDARLDFETRVDWRERRKTLRASFPTTLRCDGVDCGVQFGFIRRPVFANTSWESAKGEICAQGWINLRRPDAGLALMSGCKYGYHVEPELLDIALLRSPVFPDPTADEGEHRFSYSLLPNRGDADSLHVMRRARELRSPLRLSGASPSSQPLVEVDSDTVFIESVKMAQDSRSVIVRLHETLGGAVRARIRPGFRAAGARMTDLVERDLGEVGLDPNGIALVDFGPFEIRTLSFAPADPLDGSGR
jgi:alpha-mannosidase